MSMAEEAASRNLILIAVEGCEPCKELQKEVQSEAISTILKNEYGVDVSKMRVLYGDKEGPEGDEARSICFSLGHFGSPLLVLEEKGDGGERRLCLLGDDLVKKECGQFKELPM